MIVNAKSLAQNFLKLQWIKLASKKFSKPQLLKELS